MLSLFVSLYIHLKFVNCFKFVCYVCCFSSTMLDIMAAACLLLIVIMLKIAADSILLKVCPVIFVTENQRFLGGCSGYWRGW